jgi:hypothetical protein
MDRGHTKGAGRSNAVDDIKPSIASAYSLEWGKSQSSQATVEQALIDVEGVDAAETMPELRNETTERKGSAMRSVVPGMWLQTYRNLYGETVVKYNYVKIVIHRDGGVTVRFNEKRDAKYATEHLEELRAIVSELGRSHDPFIVEQNGPGFKIICGDYHSFIDEVLRATDTSEEARSEG